MSVTYEASIYFSNFNKLFVSQDGGPENLSNIVTNLNEDTRAFATDPHLYQRISRILYAARHIGIFKVTTTCLRPGELKQHPRVINGQKALITNKPNHHPYF